MYRDDSYPTFANEIQIALETACERHGREPYDALTVCAVLSAINSSVKLHALQGGPLAQKMGRLALRAFYAARPVEAVEAIKRPGSMSVNPVMEATVAVLAGAQTPMPEPALYDQTITVISDVMPETTFRPAFESALAYLSEASILAPDADGAWTLNGELQWDVNAACDATAGT